MMQSSGLQASLSGLLAQLFGGLSGGGDSLDETGDSAFLDDLGGQLKDLLIDRGVDPAEIAAINGQELLAQFVALIQGAQPVQEGPDFADGLALGVSDASDGWPETPTDLLGRLLESASAGTAVASDLLESGSDVHSFLAELTNAPVSQASTDRLARLLESASVGVGRDPAGMTSDADGRSMLAASAASADTRMLADRVGRALESMSAEADVASEVVESDSNGRSALAAVATSPASQAAMDRLGHLLESVSRENKAEPGASTVSSDVRSLLSDLANSADVRRAASSVSPLADAGLVSGEAGATVPSPAAGSMADRLNLSLDRGPISGIEEGVDSGMDLADSQADSLQKDADTVVNEEGVSMTAATATTSRSAAGAGLQRPGSLDLYRLLQPGGEAPLGKQVKWVLGEGLSRAEMKLRPPSLGGLDVKITQEGDKTSVIFVSPHPIVREVLEAAMPRLRDALAQDGVSLANLSVTDQGAQGGDASPGRDGAPSNEASRQGDADDAETIGEPLLINTTVSALSKRLDYYI
ncbi:flagellar hook-length control protein FliK [Thiorhodococcus fuscus]|uniref:Flagellar hook-length control protein FliK n=1 Tax=Thiorhodococcus fuscus TaxID=527200 RepID=A0ABW4YBN9_9GAMM